jgi:hypothetical protein
MLSRIVPVTQIINALFSAKKDLEATSKSSFSIRFCTSNIRAHSPVGLLRFKLPVLQNSRRFSFTVRDCNRGLGYEEVHVVA